MLIVHHDVPRINASSGGENFVDFLPWLRFIPKMPYKAKAAAYYALAEKTYKTLFEEAKVELVCIPMSICSRDLTIIV